MMGRIGDTLRIVLEDTSMTALLGLCHRLGAT
jgi:hypothetical protein